MSKAINEALKALREAEEQEALATGRGQRGVEPVTVARHIGITKGLAKAIDIVRDTAQRVAKEDNA